MNSTQFAGLWIGVTLISVAAFLRFTPEALAFPDADIRSMGRHLSTAAAMTFWAFFGQCKSEPQDSDKKNKMTWWGKQGTEKFNHDFKNALVF